MHLVNLLLLTTTFSVKISSVHSSDVLIKQFPEIMINHISFVNCIPVFMWEHERRTLIDQKTVCYKLYFASCLLLPEYFPSPISLDLSSSFPSQLMAFFCQWLSLQHQGKHSWRDAEQPSSPSFCPETWLLLPFLLCKTHRDEGCASPGRILNYLINLFHFYFDSVFLSQIILGCYQENYLRWCFSACVCSLCSITKKNVC